ncbi:uncharacterized protein [Manis javanica]|uniref:uncharacterized protein n=1 Tax=Manis javanica TaxID=9974 RepID=UPI003C6CC635
MIPLKGHQHFSHEGLSSFPEKKGKRTQQLCPPGCILKFEKCGFRSELLIFEGDGSPSCDLSWSGALRARLPTTLLTRGSRPCVGQQLGRVHPSRLKTPALPFPPFSAPFAAVSPLPWGARERLLEEEQGEEGKGQEEGRDLLRHTHAHTAGHVSGRQLPARARRGPGGGLDSASRGERGAGTAWHQRLQDPAREDPAVLTAALLGGSEERRLPNKLSPRTPEALPRALRVWDRAGACRGRGGCAPPPAERLGARALLGLRLRRPPVPCPRRESAPCRTWLQPPGEVQKTRPNSTTSPASSSARLPARDPAAAAACVRGPPAAYSHARTHSPARSRPFTPTRFPPRRSPGIRNYPTNCRRECRSRRTQSSDPPPASPPPGPRDDQVPRHFSIDVFPSQWHFWCPPQESPWPTLKHLEVKQNPLHRFFLKIFIINVQNFLNKHKDLKKPRPALVGRNSISRRAGSS